MIPANRWHRCPDCEVRWRGEDNECWSCGRKVHPDPFAAPKLGDQSGLVQAMTDDQWEDVRREIGAA